MAHADPFALGIFVAMAGFGGGGADTSATAPLSADTSQPTLLTTPHA